MSTYGYSLYLLNRFGDWMRADSGSLYEMAKQGKKSGIRWRVMLGGSIVDSGGPRKNPGGSTSMKTTKKTSRRSKIIVPTPSTPETRARAKERAAKSKVVGKLFSAGDPKLAMKLARGKISVVEAKKALR